MTEKHWRAALQSSDNVFTSCLLFRLYQEIQEWLPSLGNASLSEGEEFCFSGLLVLAMLAIMHYVCTEFFLYRYTLSLFFFVHFGMQKPCHARMIKEYQKEAADKANSLNRDLRPSETLQRTLLYLLHRVTMGPNE